MNSQNPRNIKDDIDHFIKWCAKMRGNNMEKQTTITLSRNTVKDLMKIKYNNDLKSMDEVIKFLLNKKKQ